METKQLKLTQFEYDVFEYLNRLRKSGATNMYGASEYILRDFKTTKERSKQILTKWMKNFDDNGYDYCEIKEPKELKFIGIDFWSRPIFKSQDGFYFSCLNKLAGGEKNLAEIKENLSLDERDITYHGTDPDDDPMGTEVMHDRIILVEEFTNNTNNKND